MRLGALLFVLATTFAGGSARAASEASPDAVLAAAVASAERGAFDEAVNQLELLSDSGFVHPDASYARAFAYVERARSRGKRPGDLGRAAAALEESLRLRPDETVEQALTTLRSEIARLRAREGNAPVLQRPSLGRAVAGLASENLWANAAALGSALVTIGLALYLAVKRRAAEIAGATGIVVGVVLGITGAALALAARHYRLTSHPAVVVVPDARLLDADGRALSVRAGSPSAVQEGSLVYVREQRDGRARVEWGAVEGWVNASQLRMLQTPFADRR